MGDAVGEHLGVGVHHEDDLIEIGGDAGDPPQAVEHLELEFGHAFIKHDLLQERHQDDLAVAFPPVAGLTLLDLVLGPAFDHHHHGDPLLLRRGDDRVLAVVIKAGVDFGHVVPLGPTGHGHAGKGLHLVRQHRKIAHHAQADLRGRDIFPVPFDQAITHDQDHLVAVGIVGGGDRIERGAKAFFAFRVGGDEADDMCEGVSKWLPLRRRLRHHRFVNEARQPGPVDIAHADRVLWVLVRRDQA